MDQSKGSAKDGSRPTGTDKGNGDDASQHAGKSGKTGVAAPSPGVNGKEGADPAIDTRISVNQGHQLKGLGKRPFSSSNVNVAAKGNRQHVVDNHRSTPIRPAADQRRNSIGAVVDHDKAAAERRNATGALITLAPTASVEPKANSAPPATVATVHAPTAVRPVGNVPVNNSPPAAQPAIRPNVTPAAASANGPSINGTGMIRPASRIAAIGGPAKVAPGVLRGSSFRLKHP